MIVYVRKDEKTGARLLLLPRAGGAEQKGDDKYWMDRGYAIDGNTYVLCVTIDKLLEAEKDLLDIFAGFVEFE